jgi:hypothetical protein
MRRLAMAALILAASCAPALAGPFKKNQVPDSAGWVAHVDVQAFLASQVGKFALEEARKQEAFNAGLGWLQQAFGFNPLMDLKGVTLYGQRLGDDVGVVILDALVSQEKVLPPIQANETYKSTEYGKHTLHQWSDPPKPVRDKDSGEITSYVPGKKQVGCFYDDNTVVIGSNVNAVQKALDTMDGKGGNLAKKPMAGLAESPKGTFIVAAAGGIELPGKDTGKPEAMILRQIVSAALQAGETDGKLFVDLAGTIKTAERAAKVAQIIQGIVAFGQVMMEERPDIPALGEKVDVTADGTTVRVKAVAPSDSVAKLVRFFLGQGQAPKTKPAAAAKTEK